MSDHFDPAYPVVWQPAPPACGASDGCATLVRLAALGAVIGGAAAAAGNLRRMESGEIEGGEAIAATARSALVGAAATAVAGAVAGTVAEQGVLRLGLMFAVGTGVAYGLEEWLGRGREAGHA